MKQIEHGCGKDGLIRKTEKKEGITTDKRRMGTNEEKTLNRGERRLAAKERRERNRSKIRLARSGWSENGEMEWWSNGGRRNGVSESLNDDSSHDGSGKGVEKATLEGGWRRVLAENGCAQLYVFTRIYTLLHKVSGGNVMSDKTHKKWARIAGLGMMKSWFWIRVPPSVAFRRLLPPSVAFSRGAVELECEIERKGRLARTYFRFGKWGNKLLN